jgi:hypothetical protein
MRAGLEASNSLELEEILSTLGDNIILLLILLEKLWLGFGSGLVRFGFGLVLVWLGLVTLWFRFGFGLVLLWFSFGF